MSIRTCIMKHYHYTQTHMCTHQHSIGKYRIYSKARQGFFLRFGTLICELSLNSHTKCWTGPRQAGLLWTGPCRAKPRPASSDHHVRSALLQDIKQYRVVIHYLHFGTTEVNWQSLSLTLLSLSPLLSLFLPLLSLSLSFFLFSLSLSIPPSPS